MSLILRNSYSPVSLFDDFFKTPALSSTAKFVPDFDIIEDEASYKLVSDLPGVKADDIDISIHLGKLTISGARNIENEGATHIERVSGSFSRTFALPEGTTSKGIKADVKDGVLTVTVQKTPEAKPKKIPVKVI